MKSILIILFFAAFGTMASAQSEEPAPPERVFYYVEQMPRFPGDDKALSTYLATNLRYPEAAKKKGTEGRVQVQFIVRADGSITDIALKSGIGDGCDEEALRLVKNMPRWTPGKQNGRPVTVSYTLPITFKLTATMRASAQTQQPDTGQIFTYVEQMPEYPGGHAQLMKYLAENLHYPEEAVENGTSGKVIVDFIIRADGSITDITIKRGIGDGCDEEALRVIKNMPHWIPGKQNGIPVNVSYTLPIVFALN